METKHTPGPWKVEQYSGHPHYEIYNTEPQRVASLQDHLPQSENNAYLIAAAPEMLSALKFAEDLLCGRLVGVDPGNKIVLPAIQAALAKAEGVTP